MKDRVLNFLKVRYEKSNGQNGTYIPTIQQEFDLQWWILKPILSELHQEKLITTKQGINGILIYYKQQKQNYGNTI